MRVIRRIVVVGAVVATVVGVGLGTSGPALADPSATPSLTTLVGVSCNPALDQLVTDYNATNPTYRSACWDPVNPSTGVEDQTIEAKASGSGDTSCSLTRPDGSSAGIFTLNQSQEDVAEVNGKPYYYCMDFAFSGLSPNTTTFHDAFVGLGSDAIAWSYPQISGYSNPQPPTLTLAALVDIYGCTVDNWDQVGGSDAPIIPVLPVFGTDTRSTWLAALGITASSEPCWVNGVDPLDSNNVINADSGLSAGNEDMFDKSSDVFSTYNDSTDISTADTGSSLDVIYPYSIGDWIAQGSAVTGTGAAGTAGAATVGGHASSTWGHGDLTLAETDNSLNVAEAPITTNSDGQPVMSHSFPSRFWYTLYAVVRNGYSSPTSSADATLPTAPAYDATGLADLFGSSGWFCTNATAQSDWVSYGFALIGSACGSLTAGD